MIAVMVVVLVVKVMMIIDGGEVEERHHHPIVITGVVVADERIPNGGNVTTLVMMIHPRHPLPRDLDGRNIPPPHHHIIDNDDDVWMIRMIGIMTHNPPPDNDNVGLTIVNLAVAVDDDPVVDGITVQIVPLGEGLVLLVVVIVMQVPDTRIG